MFTIERSICDFIAGMTDRYAINLYKSIKMNFFNIYLRKIKKTIIKNKKKLDLNDNQILNKIIVESPPENFDCDLSTNIALY